MNDHSLCAKDIDEKSTGFCHTYEHAESKTYIDHILVSQNFDIPVQKCTILSRYGENMSDHLAVSITLDCEASSTHIPNMRQISFTPKFWTCKENIDEYNSILERDVKLVLSKLTNANLEERLSAIISLLCNSSNEASASLKVYIRKKDGPRWWTPELSALHNKQKALFKHKHVSYIMESRHKIAKREYKRVIRISKKQYQNKNYVNFEKLKYEDPKRFWKNLKSQKNSVPYAINGLRREIDISNGFKDHFENFSTEKNDYTNNDYNIKVKEHHKKITSAHGTLEPIKINLTHLDEAIRSLKTGKTCGPDDIYAEMLANCNNAELLTFISQFYSDVLTSGTIPQILGDARMIPLVKNTKKGYADPNNYRPISLISILAKVLELIFLQLCPFLKDSSKLQHGFEKNDSTTHAAYTVRSTIDHYVRSGHRLYACTLDAVKAFDLVSWVGLFSKLIEKLPPLLWMALYNYYKVSAFFISYGGVNSSAGKISCGVKQGGILSPYLYSFFLNDLLLSTAKSPFGTMIGDVYTGVVCYADDIFLLSRTAYGMQQMINFAYEYGKEWKITFNPNPGKSDIICFNSLKNTSNPCFFLGNDEIKMTSKLTHLGFIWDSSCKTLLLSHAQAKVDNFVAQSKHFIARGIGKTHPNTIATIIKAQLFPLLYGMELGIFSKFQLATWQAAIQSAIKKMYRCSPHCLNKLFDSVGISSLVDYLDFRRSILENLIYNNPYTQSILFYQMENVSNTLCTSMEAMRGEKRYMVPYSPGEDGITDTLKTLIANWNSFQAQKQFRDILHGKIPQGA